MTSTPTALKKETATVRVKVFPKTLKKLKIMAARYEMSMAQLIEHLLINKKSTQDNAVVEK